MKNILLLCASLSLLSHAATFTGTNIGVLDLGGLPAYPFQVGDYMNFSFTVDDTQVGTYFQDGANTGFRYTGLDFSLTVYRGNTVIYDIPSGSVATGGMTAVAEYRDEGGGNIITVMSFGAFEDLGEGPTGSIIPDFDYGGVQETLTYWTLFAGDLASTYSNPLLSDQGEGTPLFTSLPEPGDATTLANLLSTSGFQPDFYQSQGVGGDVNTPINPGFLVGGGIAAVPELSSLWLGGISLGGFLAVRGAVALRRRRSGGHEC